ncbi:MAG: lamin tail domain-containing protein [Polyangiaceae bacterium]|nr:lamin tail domain-containing protein [Polyangiaceae bacterium]
MKRLSPLFALLSLMVPALGCSGGESDTPGTKAPADAPVADSLGRLGFSMNFTQQPHTDELNCHYIKTPNDAPAEVRRVRVTFPPGSHHVHIYRSTQAEDRDYVAPCTGGIDWDRWRMVVGVQTENIDWTLPEGVTLLLEPHQQLMVQVHWVNIGNEPVSPTVRVDFEEVPPGNSKHLGVGFGVSEDVRIDPHLRKFVGGWVPLPEGSRVIAIMGHFHERGEQYTADIRKRGASSGRDIYDAQGQQTFVFRHYETPEPIGKDEGVAYVCNINNFTQKEITFGANVADQEHCNIAVYFEPPGMDAESVVYNQGFVKPAQTQMVDGKLVKVPGTSGLSTSVKTAVAGETLTGKVELATPAGPLPVEVYLPPQPSRLDIPRIVTVPAWEQSVTFPIRGLRPGADVELQATTTGRIRESAHFSVSGLSLSEVVYDPADPNRRWVEISNTSSLPINLCEYSLGAGTATYADFARPLGECQGSTPVYLAPSGCLVLGLPGAQANPATGMMVMSEPFGAGFAPPAGGALGVALVDNVLGEWIWDTMNPPRDDVSGLPMYPRPSLLDAVAFGAAPNPNLYGPDEVMLPVGQQVGVAPLAPSATEAHERRDSLAWSGDGAVTPGICRVKTLP